MKTTRSPLAIAKALLQDVIIQTTDNTGHKALSDIIPCNKELVVNTSVAIESDPNSSRSFYYGLNNQLLSSSFFGFHKVQSSNESIGSATLAFPLEIKTVVKGDFYLAYISFLDCYLKESHIFFPGVVDKNALPEALIEAFAYAAALYPEHWQSILLILLQQLGEGYASQFYSNGKEPAAHDYLQLGLDLFNHHTFAEAGGVSVFDELVDITQSAGEILANTTFRALETDTIDPFRNNFQSLCETFPDSPPTWLDSHIYTDSQGELLLHFAKGIDQFDIEEGEFYKRGGGIIPFDFDSSIRDNRYRVSLLQITGDDVKEIVHFESEYDSSVLPGALVSAFYYIYSLSPETAQTALLVLLTQLGRVQLESLGSSPEEKLLRGLSLLEKAKKRK